MHLKDSAPAAVLEGAGADLKKLSADDLLGLVCTLCGAGLRYRMFSTNDRSGRGRWWAGGLACGDGGDGQPQSAGSRRARGADLS